MPKDQTAATFASTTFPEHARRSLARSEAPSPTTTILRRIDGIEPQGDLPTIEVVRGRLDARRSEELLGFWAERAAVADVEARRRLAEVVCVLRAGDSVVGASSVYPAGVPLIGGRRFWVYRSLLDPGVIEQSPAMIRATFGVLQAEFDGAPASPLGLCLLIADPEERHRRPEAGWTDPRLDYAGYLADGRQVRIGYFGGAIIRRV